MNNFPELNRCTFCEGYEKPSASPCRVRFWAAGDSLRAESRSNKSQVSSFKISGVLAVSGPWCKITRRSLTMPVVSC